MGESVLCRPGFGKSAPPLQAVLQRLGIVGGGASGPVELEGRRFYLKYCAYPLRTRLLRAVGVTGPWRSAPLFQEAFNLELLRGLGVPALEPAAFWEVRRGGLLVEELLLTCWEAGAVSLFDAALCHGLSAAHLAAICARVGRLIAKMHGHGFVHRDLFLRNLLVRGPTEDGPEILLSDCRKGTRTRIPGRGVIYDLACFDKWAASVLPVRARRAFFSAYLAARPVADRPRWLAGIERARRRLVRRFHQRKRHRRQLLPSLEAPPLLAVMSAPSPDLARNRRSTWATAPE